MTQPQQVVLLKWVALSHPSKYYPGDGTFSTYFLITICGVSSVALNNAIFCWSPSVIMSSCRRSEHFSALLGPQKWDRAPGSASGVLSTTLELREMWPSARFIFAKELALEVLFVELLIFFYNPCSPVEFVVYIFILTSFMCCLYSCFCLSLFSLL